MPPKSSPPAPLLDRISAHWAFGLICVVICGLSFATVNFVSKILTTDPYDPLQPLWLTSFGQVVCWFCMMPMVPFSRAPYITKELRVWPYLVIRAVGSGTAIVATHYAIQRIPVSDFATIGGLTPIVTMLASWPLLGERLKITDVPVLLLCVVGVFFIVRPQFIFGEMAVEMTTDMVIGYILTVVFVILQSVAFLSLRKVTHIPAATCNLSYATMTVIPMLIVTTAVGYMRWPPCSMTAKLLTLLFGVAAVCVQTFQMMASKSLPAGIVSLSRPLAIFFLCVFQIFSTFSTHWLSYVGASVIVVAVSFLGFRSFLVFKIERIPPKERTKAQTKMLRIFNA